MVDLAGAVGAANPSIGHAARAAYERRVSDLPG
jgi:hypothetical protein